MEEQQAQEPRNVIVDDVSYVVADLPVAIQNAIAAYDVWVADRNNAQKEAAQLAAAVQHLATQISTAIKEQVQSEEVAASGVPTAGDDAPAPVEAAAAALDIPAEDE